MSLPTYNIATGIADRTMRKSALINEMEGLVFQTDLKNFGRFPSAENLSFKLTSDTV